MSEYYAIRKDGSIYPVADVIEWAKVFDREDRKIARTEIGGVTVSTVFLGLNHAWGDGPPLLFETLVIEGPLDGNMDRYSTIEEARAGHEAMCEEVKKAAPQVPRKSA